jgi:histidinol-phosphate phosphatase family protein
VAKRETADSAELSVRFREPGRRFPGRTAALLDRDGVINNNGWYVNSVEEFELLPGAATAIRRLNDAGIPVVVITNQGSVALEYLTLPELERIHQKMDRLLAAEGAHIDALYAALTYPEGTVPELTKESKYRKPEPGMIEQARDDLGIDPRRSYVVGDATSDILAGNRAGCFTILVETGFAGQDGKAEATPNAVVADLSAAVDLILAAQNG